MCVTSIYTDRYPDGKVVYFRKTRNCKYGSPSRPCLTASTVEEPLRDINWGELTTEQLLNPRPEQRPFTPPRSPASSHHRHSSSESSGHRRRHSKHVLPTRQHRKAERIVIVDSPPTPRTPPQHYSHTFTAPSSPLSPPFRSHERERGRPVIVDERPLRRNPSIGAVVGDRLTPRNSRDYSRTRNVIWDSPSNSHTSFNSRLRREEEAANRAREEHEQQRQMRRDIEVQIKLEKEQEREDRRRKEEFIRRQDEEIRNRPVVPLVPMPPSLRRQHTQIPHRGPVVTVVEQANALPTMFGGLAIRDDRHSKESEEAMKRRLRERQLPKRRASVGVGHRRHRVAYDDGLYRWE